MRSPRYFEPLLACQLEETAELSTKVPELPNDARRVRAGFLRFLLLGGDDQALMHACGVHIGGSVPPQRSMEASIANPHT